MTTLDKLKDDFNKIGHRNATLNNLTLIAELFDRLDALEKKCDQCNTKHRAKRTNESK